jgi:hypothetical protein
VEASWLGNPHFLRTFSSGLNTHLGIVIMVGKDTVLLLPCLTGDIYSFIYLFLKGSM